MSALQWIVKEAKSLKKSYPKRFTKWTDYVKQASAIYASKHGGKSPVGKNKAVKKVAVKKSAKKKIGATPKKDYIFNAFKYKTNPKTGGYEVQEKKQFKIVSTNLETANNNAHKKYPYPWVIELNNSSLTTSKKVGVIKKKVLHSPLKKKSMKKPISTHKDTKSHNVNIRVVSGIGDKKRAIDTLMLMEKDLNNALLRLEIYKNFPIIKGGNLNSNSFKNITQKRWFVKRITNEIKARKKGVSEQYKLIKSI